jgi:hypothetical protein
MKREKENQMAPSRSDSKDPRSIEEQGMIIDSLCLSVCVCLKSFDKSQKKKKKIKREGGGRRISPPLFFNMPSRHLTHAYIHVRDTFDNKTSRENGEKKKKNLIMTGQKFPEKKKKENLNAPQHLYK